MHRSRRPILFAAFLLIAAALACSFSFSTAKIKRAQMTSDKEGKNPTTVYSPTDTFYCVVVLKNAPDDTKTKAVWKVVDVPGQQPDTQIGEYEMTSGSATLTFNVTPPNTSWPVGKYKVELYLNDKKEKTLDFEVK
jgi:hypothetical protein